MTIVIVGAGEVGLHIANQLVSGSKDVTIIEKNPEIAARARDSIDCLVIIGEGTNVETLKAANVDKADIFIAATSIDEVNMMSCFVAASEFNVPIKIARVKKVEYIKNNLLKNSDIGIDYIVNPELEAAEDIIHTVNSGATTGIYTFGASRAQLRDFIIKDDSPFVNVHITEVRKILAQNFIIACVVRGDQIFVPKGDFQLLEGDHIYVVAIGRSFNAIFNKIGLTVDKLKKIIVVGGGLISKQVVSQLLEDGKIITIIEKDFEKCKELSSLFPEADVINGDISDREVFQEENLGSADAIVSTTANEELNILSGVYAKSKGVKRAIAVIDRLNYTPLAGNLGIDSCISAKLSSGDAILKFIRKGKIRNVYTIFEGTAEAIEFKVSKKSPFLGKKIKDLELPEDSLILSVQRNRKTYIPTGDFEIALRDIIIIFITIDQIKELEDLIQ